MDSLKYAYELTKKGIFIGILTLPLNKYKLNKSVSKNFIDQTSFFSKKEDQKNSNMIFYYQNKKIYFYYMMSDFLLYFLTLFFSTLLVSALVWRRQLFL